MSDSRNNVGLAVAAVFVVPFILYVGSYLALTDPRRGSMGALHPKYRVADEIRCVVFAPLEWLDRKIRPMHWGPIGGVAYDLWYAATSG
jgi:hypothetical protein